MYKPSQKNIELSQKVIKRLKEAIDFIKKLYSDNLREIVLFGSYAKGTNKPFSSLDLLIILYQCKDRFINRKTNLEKALNSHDIKNFPLIDALIYTEDEILDLIDQKESFIVSALSEGIVIWSNKKEQIDLESQSDLMYHKSRYYKYLPKLDDIYFF